MPSTIHLHRVLQAPPDRVYRAFTDPDAQVKWLPPNGFTAKMHHSDARVGGSYKMSFTNFTTGSSHSFGGKYVEMVPGELLRYTDTFDDPNLPGDMNVTVKFTLAAPVGLAVARTMDVTIGAVASPSNSYAPMSQ